MDDSTPKALTTRHTHDVVVKLLTAVTKGRILDAPAGQGALSERLERMGFDVTALDTEPEKFRVGSVACVRADLNDRLPFEDEDFDAVACIDGIEHIENPFALLREFHRVLKPRGTLIVSTPNLMCLRSRWRFLWSGFHIKYKRPLDEGKPTPSHHITPLTFAQLRYAMTLSGFRLTRTEVNQAKLQSWPYLLMYPFVWLYTQLAFRHERDRMQRTRNAGIARVLLSAKVLLGETLILKAEKQAEARGEEAAE